MIKIVITRPVDAAGETAELIRQVGFQPIIFPLLKLSAVDDIMLKATDNNYQWLLFTSSNAVRFFMSYSKKHRIHFNRKKKIAAIGPSTAKTLEKFDLHVDFIPEMFNRTAISEQMPVDKGDRILYPSLLDGPTRIEEILNQRACTVERLDVYKSESIIYSEDHWQELVSKNPDVITFLSAKTVDAFFENNQSLFDLNQYTSAVMADSCAAALVKNGYRVHIKTDVSTAENLLGKIKEYYG